MFTGLIEEIGQITAITPQQDAMRLTVRGPKVVSDVKHGDSIQVSGVCLTVIDHTPEAFTADVMAQTLNMSALGDLEVGSPVNLERAARLDTRLGGHIVQGHVDGTATLETVTPAEHWRVLRFVIDESLAPLLVEKGSITVAGVSLTISDISAAEAATHWFEVSLIPETLTATTLGALEPGDRVNIETDMIARHVARILSFPNFSASTINVEGNHA